MFLDFYIQSEKDGEIPKKNDQESGRIDLIGWGQSSLWGETLAKVVRSCIGEERRETEISSYIKSY